MIAAAQPAKRFLAAFAILAGLTAGAWAAEKNPPPAAPAPAAPAPAAPAPAAAPPSAAAVAAAGDILGDIGIKEKIALVVPAMMAELERNVTNTRPEIRDSLRQTLRAIQPEFDKTAQQTFDEAATLLASQMSEKELQDVAGFFASPAGKKYLAIEPVFLQKLSAIAEPWRQKLSTDILTRAREEMKKKGVEF
jgi:hypothetical protein